MNSAGGLFQAFYYCVAIRILLLIFLHFSPYVPLHCLLPLRLSVFLPFRSFALLSLRPSTLLRLHLSVLLPLRPSALLPICLSTYSRIGINMSPKLLHPSLYIARATSLTLSHQKTHLSSLLRNGWKLTFFVYKCNQGCNHVWWRHRFFSKLAFTITGSAAWITTSPSFTINISF